MAVILNSGRIDLSNSIPCMTNVCLSFESRLKDLCVYFLGLHPGVRWILICSIPCSTDFRCGYGWCQWNQFESKRWRLVRVISCKSRFFWPHRMTKCCLLWQHLFDNQNSSYMSVAETFVAVVFNISLQGRFCHVLSDMLGILGTIRFRNHYNIARLFWQGWHPKDSQLLPFYYPFTYGRIRHKLHEYINPCK